MSYAQLYRMSLVKSNAAKIAIGWAVLTVSGIYAFVLSKNSIEKRRLESMQVRDRMKKSNQGEYEPLTDRRFGA